MPNKHSTTKIGPDSNCLNCGISFHVKPYKLKSGRGKYCSRSCFVAYRENRRPQITCKQCGKTFRVFPARLKSNDVMFCSVFCNAKNKKRTSEERFFSFVNKTPSCWEWTGGQHKFGYGVMTNNSYKTTLAHRISWIIHNGPIPPGMSVLHSCDNPKCVNPQHLFIGSQKDNISDMVSKGRHCHGESARFSKLSDEKVKFIREANLYGFTLSQIAKQFHVDIETIRMAIKRQTWKHVA